MTERIYRAEMFKLSIAAKAQGLKPYYVLNGEIVPILVNSCRNRWGRIYLLTDDELRKALPISIKVEQIKLAREKEMELLNELVESTVNDIIPKQ